MNIVCIEMEIRELIGIMNDSLNIVCIEIQSIPPWNLWVWRIYPYFDDNFHVLNARRVLRLLLVSSPATPRRRLWLGRRAHCHQERGNWYIWRFPKVGTPKSSIYRWIFNYKPSILGHPRLFHPHTLEFKPQTLEFPQHKTTFDPQTLRFSQYPWLCILGAYRCG